MMDVLEVLHDLQPSSPSRGRVPSSCIRPAKGGVVPGWIGDRRAASKFSEQKCIEYNLYLINNYIR